MATAVVEQPILPDSEQKHCFVCDVVVTGKFFQLSTCMSHSTKRKLVDKLGELVGERYMVLVNDCDIICRGCANLMNILDRLEVELSSVRNVILRFLERKYALEEGELLNNFTGPESASQRSTDDAAQPDTDTPQENAMAKKRKAALQEIEKEKSNAGENDGASQKDKSNIWLQCDKCKYMTHYNAFMLHHIRQHYRKEAPKCDYCGSDVGESNTCVKECEMSKSANSSNTVLLHGTINGEKINGEASSTVHVDSRNNANELPSVILETNEKDRVTETVSSGVSRFIVIPSQETKGSIVLPTVSSMSNNIEMFEPSINVNQTDGLSLSQTDNEMTDLHLHMSESLGSISLTDGTPASICVMDMSDMNMEEQPALLAMDKMQVDQPGEMYVQVVEMGDSELNGTTGTTKQLLTLTEDGTVQMVEVLWDPEMVTQDMEPREVIQF